MRLSIISLYSFLELITIDNFYFSPRKMNWQLKLVFLFHSLKSFNNIELARHSSSVSKLSESKKPKTSDDGKKRFETLRICTHLRPVLYEENLSPADKIPKQIYGVNLSGNESFIHQT